MKHRERKVVKNSNLNKTNKPTPSKLPGYFPEINSLHCLLQMRFNIFPELAGVAFICCSKPESTLLNIYLIQHQNSSLTPAVIGMTQSNTLTLTCSFRMMHHHHPTSKHKLPHKAASPWLFWDNLRQFDKTSLLAFFLLLALTKK